MLALNVDNPKEEKYFHNNPKEASDLLEAVATNKAVIVFNNHQTNINELKELQSLIDFNNANKISIQQSVDISGLADEIHN